MKKSRRVMTQQQQQQQRDVPEELIQYIQSLLPVEEAARTCVLSKSWMHAWSTIPTLRFRCLLEHKEANYIKLINRTLRRYHRDAIPVVTFDLHFDVHDQKAVSLMDKWVRKVASKSCLKELYLMLSVGSKSSYTLPDEIFSSQNLNTISVALDFRRFGNGIPGPLRISNNNNVVINCVNLRVIELLDLHISVEILDKLFSTCTLLEKISLTFYNKHKTLRIKSLRYLRELRITLYDGKRILEIYDLPSLNLFFFDSSMILTSKRLWFNKDSIGSLRKLFLQGVVIDNAFCDILKSNFPFLEILSLDIERCKKKTLVFTFASLQRLVIELQKNEQIDIQFCAPRLRYFRYTGEAIPNLSFPIADPHQKVVLKLKLRDPVDHSFFIKMRETLESSSNFKIKIDTIDYRITLPSKIDDFGIKVMSPATNVQKLTLNTLWTHLPLLDAIFSICHPKYVKAGSLFMIPNVTRCLQNLIARRVPDLKDFEVENRVVEECGAITRSWTKFVDEPWCDRLILFRLAWLIPGSFTI